jgi:hypothetical protein
MVLEKLSDKYVVNIACLGYLIQVYGEATAHMLLCFAMPSLPPHTRPSWRHVTLWITLGLLLGALFHGYWRLACILFVGNVALFVLLQMRS